MTETIKSVLLVDYDSLHRSLSKSDEAAAERLAARLVAWVSAIEIGSLFATTSDEAPPRRRFLIRRCYADPSLLASDRAVFLSNGFQVVDCPPAEGRTHNAAAIHMVLDSIDALDHPAGYDDYVLLSTDSDLTPLLIRLRAHNRTTSIYTNTVTAESYKTIADGMIEESRFAEILLSDDEPTLVEEEEEAPPKAERSEIEALARKISSTTNVPLFAPRTFADLFRHLVEEVADNGYHFQKTAENVATRMADGGRNVSRRQVVFVVKGLALKGHVFSSGDTADRLADVFREQVLYLAESAGLELDDNERQVISAWIVGSIPTPAKAADEAGDSAKAEKSKNEAKPSTARPTPQQPGRSSRKRQARANGSTKPREEAKSASAPAKTKPAAEPAKPIAQTLKPTPKSSETKKQSASPSAAPAKSAASDDKPAATSARPSSAATRPAQSRTSAEDENPRQTAQAEVDTKQAAPTPAIDLDTDTDSEKDVESSILAAIAEAVDVLVEDSGGKAAEEPAAEAPKTATPPAAKKPAPVEEKPEEEGIPEGDDIGDEIQRIIASYNRNRNKDDPE